MNLYNNYMDSLSLLKYLEEIEENGGEIDNVEVFDHLCQSREDFFNQAVLGMTEYQAVIDGLKDKMKFWKTKIEKYEAKIEKIENLCKVALGNEKSFMTAFGVKVAKTSGVSTEITDEKLVPDEYKTENIKVKANKTISQEFLDEILKLNEVHLDKSSVEVEVTISKTDVKKAIKAGKTVEGAKLLDTVGITMK